MNQKAASEPDVRGRLAFMQLDEQKLDHVRRMKGVVERELPQALDKFYAQLRGAPEVSRFFSDESHVGRAKNAQISHWAAISQGRFDSHYLANVRRIGGTHARIGLEPRWYVGGYALIIEHLVGAIVADMAPAKIGRGLSDTLGAFVKAVLLDIELAISVYFEAAENARKEAEAAAQAKEQALVTSSVGQSLSRLAQNDLQYRMDFDLPPAYARLQDDYNSAAAQFEGALRGVSDAVEAMDATSNEIAAASDDLARRTEEQAASLEEATAAVKDLSDTLAAMVDMTAATKEAISAAKRDTETSSGVVGKSIAAMDQILGSSQQINQIVGVIDEIALQTNLLALNAGVEAARAGDAGRGFAVVAAEVRALARRSADAAKEIRQLLTRSTSEVEIGVKLARATGQALNRILAQISNLENGIGGIASGAVDRAVTMKQVSQAIGQIDQSTQRNAAMAEEATAPCRSLAKASERVAQMMRQFKISREHGATVKRAHVGAQSSRRHVS